MSPIRGRHLAAIPRNELCAVPIHSNGGVRVCAPSGTTHVCGSLPPSGANAIWPPHLAVPAEAPLLRTTEEALRLLERLDDPALELVVASLHDLRRSSRGQTGAAGVVIPLFGGSRRAH